MHQASLIGHNIIVTTGCSSSHLLLAGPSSAHPLCLTHAPSLGHTLAPSRHACGLFFPNAHFPLPLPPTDLGFVWGQWHTAQHSTALGFVCVKQPEENWPFPLFPYCPHQFMEVSQGVAPQNAHAQVRVGTCVGHHWPSSPAPGSTQHQKSNPMSESAVQSFLQLQQLCAHRPMGQNLYLTSPDPHLASPGTSPNKLRQVPCCPVRAVKVDFRGFAKWLIFTKI